VAPVSIDALPRLIEDLREARRTIDLQYDILRDDPFTREFKAVPAERATSGVEARLLYDPFGSLFQLTGECRRELVDAGARMTPVSGLQLIRMICYRDHRKIAVVDGRIGYTGGMNIGQEHLDGRARA
jgi:cardiolipin synthase A/B